MTDAPAEQQTLFTGFYRCDDCGRLVERLRRSRRFRLCDDCYERIVPAVDTIEAKQIGSPAHQAITRYWEWYGEIDKRVPRRVEPGHAARTRQQPLRPRKADEFYPLCDCGRPRQVSTIARDTSGGGLFGGPFHKECAICEARGHVERVVKLTAGIHPEWDDEDWLDHLYRVFPEAFKVGVLPDYWYELRGRGRGAAEDGRATNVG